MHCRLILLYHLFGVDVVSVDLESFVVSAGLKLPDSPRCGKPTGAARLRANGEFQSTAPCW